MNLKEHLNNSIESEPVNESLILGGILAASLIAPAIKGIFDSDFMKAITPGFNSILSGIGNTMHGFGLFGGVQIPSMDPDDLDKLLKKDPDDLTGIEKKQLKNLAKNKKYKDYLSNKQLAKLNATIAAIDTVDGKDEKKEETKEDNVATEYTEEMMAGLMTMAKKANDTEKDKTKKAENDAMLDIMSACMYDKNGNDIPMDQRLETMKGIVGEDKWEAFKADITKKYEENKDNKDFLKAVEKAKNDIKKEDAESFVNNAKERAKTTLEKVEKEKQEQAEIDKDIEDLQKEIDKEKQNSVFKPEENEKLKELVDKLKKRQEDRDKLSQNSIVAQAVPQAVANAQDIQKKTEEFENAKKEHDNASKKIEDLKKQLKGKEKDSQDYKDIEKQISDKQNALADLKKKMDDAEAAKRDAETKVSSGKEPSGESKKEKTAEELDTEYKEKSDALEKEYQDKINNETDEAKKKELEDEWTEKQEGLDNELKSAKDKLKDGGDEDIDNEYNSSEDKTNYDDVDNTDEDDENEYDSNEDDGQGGKKKLQNPAKIWRRKKNKATGKITKSYYSKDSKGNEISITKDEFKDKVQAYQKAKKKAQGDGTPVNNSLNTYTNLKNFLLENVKFGWL